jgi:DNA polymerase I-like protein with 3'-5' exonuclease and polymerase domains
MFNSKYSVPVKSRKDDFELTLPVDRNWYSEDSRLLIVLESVDGTDLKAGRLLADRSKVVVENLLNFAAQQAALIDEGCKLPALAAINFNNARTFHLQTETEKVPYHTRFVRRIYAAIKKLKPTHLLICGDGAMHHLFPDVANSQWKRGWVHRLTVGDLKLKVVSTLDLEPLYVPKRTLKEEDDDGGDNEFERDDFGKCNLLGYVIRNISHCLLGRHPFSLRKVVPKPHYINTIEKFDRFYAKLKTSALVATDTETKNLSATKNAIFTIQFAFTKDEGYVIPLHHPQTPFSSEEVQYISKKLARWFIAEPEDHFIGLLAFNGKFDLRVIRAQFKLPIILRPVWEISSGEHELDENIKFLEDFGTPNGNLRATFTSYNNDLYWTMPFSKEERATIAFVNPGDKDFLDYAVLDVQSLIGMREMQLAKAKLMRLGNKSFLPFYRSLVLQQMSNTVHTISHMEQRGVFIDGYYLAHLKSKGSPLVQSIAETKRELFAMPSVVKANQLLLQKNDSVSYAKGGLFNASSWVLNLNKPEHKIVMFLDVMKLEPLTKTKTGQPQIDKNFQKAYADKHREVKLFATYQETTKLWGTYVKGWYQKIKDSPDGSFDGRLRPSYGFFRVVTGRLNSQDPSLQQVPSRGGLAKYVKRAFVAPPGTLYVKYDYSAHEVRFWGIIAKDDVIADTFKMGQSLRRKYRILSQQVNLSKAADYKRLVEEWFTYNPKTGDLIWKKKTGRSTSLGSPAGSKRDDGIYVKIEGKGYIAHRLIFAYLYGWLPDEVDHKDRDRFNNSKDNLRPATREQNAQNRGKELGKNPVSRYKGVFKHSQNGNWVAQIRPGKGLRVKHLGSFDTEEEAHKAYVRAAKKYHKQFANDGVISLATGEVDCTNPLELLQKELRQKGDVHIINIYHFFKKWVDKSHPLRDAIKAVVFGTIYQMRASSLAKSLRKQRVGELDDKVRKMRKRIAELKAELGVE